MGKKKYLPLYYQWMKSGKLPKQNGLCSQFGFIDEYGWVFPDNPLFSLMKPKIIRNDYWAADSRNDYGVEFSPLRQNIVLLMAAMNNEL